MNICEFRYISVARVVCMFNSTKDWLTSDINVDLNMSVKVCSNLIIKIFNLLHF